MKPKDYIKSITDPLGFVPTPYLRRVIRKNPRKTAREEAIAHSVIEQANPRENITGSHPWGPEEQFVLQQLWIHDDKMPEWRDVPTADEGLYSVEYTDFGELPVPNAIRQPGTVQMNIQDKIREALGE